jgi:hypothetical protein
LAITFVTLDGEVSPVWSGPQPSTGLWARMSPDGAWLGANALDLEIELQMLDRVP